MVADWAKQAYRDAAARRIDAEGVLDDIAARRERAAAVNAPDVETRRALELYLSRLDDEFRAQEAVVAILRQEEDRELANWIDKRRDAEAFQKLHDAEKEVWRLESDRKLQAELDEWGINRRPAA
jgi:flagellar export protein FliJ